jgi:hypothetical protein
LSTTLIGVTRSITKLFLGGAAVASLALTGCSAGMISQTADQVAAVPGASANLSAPVEAGSAAGSNGSVSVRDATFLYSGIAGYKAGADAPLQVRIFNDTAGPVTVTVNVDPAHAESVSLVGGAAAATPSPSDSPSPAPSASVSASPRVSGSAQPSPSAPSAPAKPAPVKLTIPSGSYLALDRESGQYLQVNGLKKPLNNASAIPLVFSFTFGAQSLDMAPLVVPVAPPLDEAAPRTVAVVPPGATEGH